MTLVIVAFSAPPAFATPVLTATADGIAYAHIDEHEGDSALIPGSGSLTITYGAAASYSVVNSSPPPAAWDMEAFATGAGTARYGSLAGHASAEASVRPATSFYQAGGTVTLDLGFTDSVLVVSDTISPGTPVVLTFVMMLDAATTKFTDQPAPPFDVAAGARLEAKITDLDDVTLPPAMRAIVINTVGSNETFATFDFNTLVGRRLELDVHLLLGAGAKIETDTNLHTQGSAQVLADNTGDFFYQPSEDVRLVSDSGHDYALSAVPEPGTAVLLLAAAGWPLRPRGARRPRAREPGTTGFEPLPGG